MFGKIVVRIAGGAVAIAAIGAVAVLAFAFMPTFFGAEALIVTSGSMGGAAPIGSVAVTRLVDARAVSVGDVITFRHAGAGSTITHRVIGIETIEGIDAFRTKGDANPAADLEPVPVSGSIHRVERVVPYAGRLVMFARTPYGGVALFLIPILGLLTDERRRRRRRAVQEISPEPEPAPIHRTTDPETIILGALAGLVVAGAVARIGSRPRRTDRRRARLVG